jgi:LPS-assembly protein
VAGHYRKNFRGLTAALLTSAAVLTYGLMASPAFAQGGIVSQEETDDSKLLLTANDLTYNRDTQRIIASGVVRLNYAGYRMVAQRVEYNQETGRVVARGNIELIEPDGNRIYADELDVTDDFAQGFVNTLRIETTDNTRIAGESAERLSDERMILNNGVYTACLPCAEKPGKAPLWQVKAQRVIQDGKSQTIRLEQARFELFGMPIGYLPFLTVPDNTVKRKSGFLFPRMRVVDKLGFGIGVPYFQVISPTSDATITPTYFTSQGLLLEGEIRNRLETGQHVLRAAGIVQKDPAGFNAGTSDAMNKERGMIASKADFEINQRWKFGWDGMVQSDNNFARTYEISGYSGDVQTNKLYLTGESERNSFEAQALYFNVQDNDNSEARERRQAIVHPVVDYRYFVPDPVYGGELSLTANLTSVTRRAQDAYELDRSARFNGLKGTYTRMTVESEWKRSHTFDSGLQLAGLLAGRGDLISSNMAPTPFTTVNGTFGYPGQFEDGFTARGVVTAGVEARYPVLFSALNSSHIVEPIAQLYLRPNEQRSGRLPNEDSQAFVFDAASLFERDKFSGYDRIEGGTRANIGIRYTGTFDNGYGLRGIFGQSYHLAGENSFASADLLNVGAESGLESDRSDYVLMAAIDSPLGLSLSNSFRLDKDDFGVNRSETTVQYSHDVVSAGVSYTRVKEQPNYGYDDKREIVQAAVTLRVNDNWSLFGSMNYDIRGKFSASRGIGIQYEDECTILALSFNDTGTGDRTREAANDWSVNARLSFRTLGDINVGSASVISE